MFLRSYCYERGEVRVRPIGRAQGGRSAATWPRPLHRRCRAARHAACGGAAFTACARAPAHRCGEGANGAGRASRADRRRDRRSRSLAVRSRVSGHRARGAALSDPSPHGGAPCWGCGCLRRRRHDRAREGRRRGACSRLGTATARDRCHRGARAQRAARLAAASWQYRLRRHARRCDGNHPRLRRGGESR